MIMLIPWHETVYLSVNWNGGPSACLKFFPFKIVIGIAFDFAWMHFQVHHGDYAWRNILCWSSDR